MANTRDNKIEILYVCKDALSFFFAIFIKGDTENMGLSCRVLVSP